MAKEGTVLARQDLHPRRRRRRRRSPIRSPTTGCCARSTTARRSCCRPCTAPGRRWSTSARSWPPSSATRCRSTPTSRPRAEPWLRAALRRPRRVRPAGRRAASSGASTRRSCTDPLDNQPWEQHSDAVAARAEDEPLIDTVLEPGDALYLPRGTIHAAEALGETSIHLTVGVHPITRYQLVQQLLDAAQDDAGAAHLAADGCRPRRPGRAGAAPGRDRRTRCTDVPRRGAGGRRRAPRRRPADRARPVPSRSARSPSCAPPTRSTRDTALRLRAGAALPPRPRTPTQITLTRWIARCRVPAAPRDALKTVLGRRGVHAGGPARSRRGRATDPGAAAAARGRRRRRP